MTITERNGLKILTADEGKILHEGTVYADTVYLGTCDSPENWAEVDADAERETEQEETVETYEELKSQMNQIKEVYA